MSDQETAFPRDEELTAIAIAYRNPDVALIGDEIFPRTPVGLKKFSYTKYDDADGFTVPDTRVGERSRVNQYVPKGSEVQAKTESYGIEIPLTNDDVSQAPKNVDPRGRATEVATNIVQLDREQRCAALAFDAANYAAAAKADLSASSGADQFSTDTSNPIKYILTKLDTCWIRPNMLALGQATWSALRVHPKVVAACLGNEGSYGAVTKERLAELLELNQIIVGASWVNSVKPGKTPVLARVWGKHALAFYRDRTVGVQGGVTFGLTAQFGTRVAGSKNVDMGLDGGVIVRSGEHVKEIIVADRAAFFFQNAAA